MRENTKIGIVGLGFVGSAVAASLEQWIIDVARVDTDPKRGGNTYDDLMECDGIFVCVPSPMASDGSCDSSILESVLAKIASYGYQGVVISKSTATPATYKKLGQMYPNLVHAPEFLTAANAVRDYANGSFAIIGGSVRAYANEAERIIAMSQPTAAQRIIFCSIEEAALAKYGINTFLATKVVFMNELYQLANTVGADFDKVANMMRMDKRIGGSHMNVPGTDGLGFDGMCFPKDTSALLHYAKDQGVELEVLDAAVRKNKVLRNTKTGV